jgi:hypothetical protein
MRTAQRFCLTVKIWIIKVQKLTQKVVRRIVKSIENGQHHPVGIDLARIAPTGGTRQGVLMKN